MAAQLEGMPSIVPVRNMARSLAFYRDTLGFEVRSTSDDSSYGLVAREHAAVMLLQTDDAKTLKATANNISCYIWVAELDALWSELVDKLAELPDGRVRAPFTQDYGMREFHVKDPDGFLIFFGKEA